MSLPDEQAVKTYRYLRIAMIALVIGLGVSVGYEVAHVAGSCLKSSISSYYHSPVRGFFVSALVAIGVCLVCLQGSTPLEDALLNLAGMLAPVVALVPTPYEAHNCASAARDDHVSSADVANNMTALLAIGAIALIVTVLLAAASREQPKIWFGIAGALGLWGATLAVFEGDRAFFEGHAHYAAAIVMFVAIIAVVSVNALHFGRHRQARGAGKTAYANRYAVVAVSMLVSVAVVLAWKWTVGFHHWVLAVEACLITLFAVFWVVQTVELWDRGLRSTSSAAAESSHPAP
ncbi:MAG: uncharacterized protein JWN31_2050 [Frankiales bacterium]|nr:uncharacterized protein [Frankiales bacterium]